MFYNSNTKKWEDDKGRQGIPKTDIVMIDDFLFTCKDFAPHKMTNRGRYWGVFWSKLALPTMDILMVTIQTSILRFYTKLENKKEYGENDLPVFPKKRKVFISQTLPPYDINVWQLPNYLRDAKARTFPFLLFGTTHPDFKTHQWGVHWKRDEYGTVIITV